MARCPNCGSSVRAGAKFCTTCGFRLPAELPADPVADVVRSPFDTTSTSSVSARWPEREANQPPEMNGADVDQPDQADELVGVSLDAQTEPDPEPDESETPVEGSAPFTGWPALGSEPATPSSWNDAAIESKDSTPSEPQNDDRSVEDVILAWGSPSMPDEQPPELADGNSADEAHVTDSEEGESEIADSQWPTVEEDEGDEAGDAVTAESSTGEADLDPERTEPTNEEVASDVDDSLYDETIEPIPMRTTATNGSEAAPSDPHARALQLADELKSVLAQLTPPEPADETVTAEVAAQLEEAAAAESSESESLQSLRAAIATAQARPRDVDVMLDLVSRAGAIADVIAAHDRYRNAIAGAVKTLRGENPDEPEPRW